jgi:hypothetical protein
MIALPLRTVVLTQSAPIQSPSWRSSPPSMTFLPASRRISSTGSIWAIWSDVWWIRAVMTFDSTRGAGTAEVPGRANSCLRSESKSEGVREGSVPFGP